MSVGSIYAVDIHPVAKILVYTKEPESSFQLQATSSSTSAPSTTLISRQLDRVLAERILQTPAYLPFLITYPGSGVEPGKAN